MVHICVYFYSIAPNRPLRNGQGSAKSDRLGMSVGADKGEQ